MAYLTFKDVQNAFERAKRRRSLHKSAMEMLNEEVVKVKDADHFDIFLSHCVKDAELIAGVKAYLEEQGQSVYVDWAVDKHLDRGKVTPETADLLRKRMHASDSMIFATSESSPDSRWMPWELGYFDGLRQGRIAILPLVATENAEFRGQEYIGLYPKVEKLLSEDVQKPYVTKGAGTRTYMSLRSFREGKTAFKKY